MEGMLLDRRQKMLRGIDVSKWQGVIDFDSLKNSTDFVIARASYGVGYTDTQFARNRDELRRLNLLRGFYTYSYPQYNTPEVEADWFCKVIGTPQEGEILCLDFEEQYSDPVNWCTRFLDRVSSTLNGYKPLIYLNLSAINSYDWKPAVDRNCGLWLARWDYNSTAPAPATDWPVVAMRQWSNKETFSGISVPTDANIFYGDKTAFLNYGHHAPQIPPVVTIEKIGKDEVIRNLYTFLCGGFSEDEINWRLGQGKSVVEIGEEICNGDGRFFDKWIKPKIPATTPTPTIPEPPSHVDTCETTLASVKTIVNSKWTWISLSSNWKLRLNQLKELLK